MCILSVYSLKNKGIKAVGTEPSTEIPLVQKLDI